MSNQNIETYGLTESQSYYKIIKFLEKSNNLTLIKLISIEMIEDNNPIVTYRNWNKEIEKFNKKYEL
jgi:hypothetical protein